MIRVAIGGVTTGAADVDALWDLLRSTAAALHAAPSGTPARSSRPSHTW